MNATRSTKIASELDLSGVGAAYLRISDDEQEIETQRVSVDDWAKRHGVTITKYFIDEGWSRDEHDIRPDWLEMLAAIDRREFNWLIIEAKDRFGTASGRKKIVYFDRLWEAGCKLFTCHQQNETACASRSMDWRAYPLWYGCRLCFR